MLARLWRLAAGAVLALAVMVTFSLLVPGGNGALAQEVRSAPGAVLRGLDKLAGQSRDLELQVGASAMLGTLRVTLAECRYPPDNPSGEAYAWVTILDERRGEVLFDGWMVATSPALHALDHARYDVWVLTCKTS